MNRGELVESVKGYVGETSQNAGPGFFTPAEYIRYVDIGNQVVNSLLLNLDSDYFLRPFAFDTTPTVVAYALPPDCSRLRSVVIVDEYGCKRRVERASARDSYDISLSSDMGTECYVLRQNQIDLYPPRSAAYRIEVWFDQVKTNLTQDIETPSSPQEFHDMIALYAAITASAKDGRAVGILTDLYKARKEDMILTYGYRGERND